jgi:hypothetical protein
MEKYFENLLLLQNTLLSYFNTPEHLKLLNKTFHKFNYEKYLTYVQPHGIVETYYMKIKTTKERKIYKNGKLDGLPTARFSAV